MYGKLGFTVFIGATCILAVCKKRYIYLAYKIT